MKITEKKKEKWINRIDRAKLIVNNIVEEISDCGVDETHIDTLSNLTCWFDEAMTEIEALEDEVRP